MKVHEVIVVECEVTEAKQNVILANLRRLKPAKFKTRRIEGVGFKVERLA